MKTPEDEAFEDIERKQGIWGGGFNAKRQAAMDKVNAEFYEEYIKYRTDFPKGYTAPQPAQEVECPNLKNCKGQCFQCEYIDAETGETCYPIAQPAQEQEEDWGALAEKQLAAIKRNTQASLEDAMVRATHKVMAEFEAQPAQEPKIKSFGQIHPRNPNATCSCEHWQYCVDCRPTTHLQTAPLPVQSVQEPVACIVKGHLYMAHEFMSGIPEGATLLYTTPTLPVQPDHLPDAGKMVQPVQEPVAWITPDGEGFRIRFSAPTNDVPLGWDALYTTPPKREWVGLTDEEIIKIHDAWTGKNIGFITGLVEAKLKEKNT